MRSIIAFIFFFIAQTSFGQAVLKVGNADFSDWTTIDKSKHDEATFASGASIKYQYPAGDFEYHGFKAIRNYAADWSLYDGLAFELVLKENVDYKALISIDVVNPRSTAIIETRGKGTKASGEIGDDFPLEDESARRKALGIKLKV
ncbi:hypothetical protein [Persicobacter psychrovividus]|uniref:DUF1080 domain-containing protein n=1 Tax=Persicobacter psychrovividus TaxID=387638 RepID=A0ABM7VLT2_9BACT|nr:hypothetical protein PEPS_42330 [Persicobacter psychrovividus]